jgi:hypothetical protein
MSPTTQRPPLDEELAREAQAADALLAAIDRLRRLHARRVAEAGDVDPALSAYLNARELEVRCSRRGKAPAGSGQTLVERRKWHD